MGTLFTVQQTEWQRCKATYLGRDCRSARHHRWTKSAVLCSRVSGIQVTPQNNENVHSELEGGLKKKGWTGRGSVGLPMSVTQAFSADRPWAVSVRTLPRQRQHSWSSLDWLRTLEFHHVSNEVVPWLLTCRPGSFFLALFEVSRASGHRKRAILEAAKWNQDAFGIASGRGMAHIWACSFGSAKKNASGETPMGLDVGRVPAALQ